MTAIGQGTENEEENTILIRSSNGLRRAQQIGEDSGKPNKSG